MIAMGYDLGAAYTKVVILKDGKVIGKGIAKTTLNPEESVGTAREAAFQDAHIDGSQIDRVGVTGSGRKQIKNADVDTTDVSAAAAGVNYYSKDFKTLIDVGGADGKGVNSAVNDKCAAGAGAFVEAMSRAMQLSLEEFAESSLASTKKIPINAQCAIFAESEVVSLISDETKREDICRAVHDGISERLTSMARRVGIEDRVALIGGAVMNKGLVKAIKDALEMDVTVLPDPLFVSAVGIAVLAAKAEG